MTKCKSNGLYIAEYQIMAFVNDSQKKKSLNDKAFSYFFECCKVKQKIYKIQKKMWENSVVNM